MKIEEIIKEKPHLQSPLELYEKIKNLTEQCKQEKERVKLDNDIALIDIVLKNFSSIFNIPFESISFLKDEIIKSGKDIIKEPDSLWFLPIQSEELSKEELERMLFILSKPFFVFLRKEGQQASFMDTGKCPVCGTDSSLAMITENNEKIMICPLCEHGGSFFRIGCPYCFNKDSSKIEILLDDEEIRAEVCLECNTYIKSFRENHYIKYRDPFLIDLISLPLDIVAQKKGYIRRSPNFIGLRVIK
ncbi:MULTISPECIES: formate dehydrogenase accessory protein FdhE [Thermodesulfovibrio]|uniref:Formate dehydrogenase accessory protein FdhE, putative n=1 Tax=Thermodesulfovibrio yellowstonii (strain ATCC 51303 / DSM 11347 / YP87) TaxID=289376 RepID=B5YFR6_THEYD|nr:MULTISPECIES: formate dehydrogenase accessory protein FdhE [Thermodesulfovibrio]ACI20212.1 formate dehydrogenase accessory protein FdhE, putative [Thermodesulfovibrio yellowstonii DSM 11347]MDI6864921.1 formate dehydrogenase accessory protein FdhE [Thermodesulfovibrio yellowstonii]